MGNFAVGQKSQGLRQMHQSLVKTQVNCGASYSGYYAGLGVL
jgi:hypothetical protein